MPVLSEQFGLGDMWHLVDFGDHAEFFLEIVKRLHPVLVVLLLVQGLIDLADVLEVHHVQLNILGRKGFFFRQCVEFDLGLGFLRLGFNGGQ